MSFYANAPLPDTNARQMAQTIRQPSTALLTIDSEDRYKDYTQARANQTSPYNFTITKNESLMPGFMTRIGISEVVFPWTIPNINLKTDQIIVALVSGGVTPHQTTIVLPNGFFRPSQIAAAIQTEVQAFLTGLGYGDTVEFAYGDTGVPAFNYTLNSTVNATTLSFAPVPYNSSTYPYPSTTKQLYDLLGFSGLSQIAGGVYPNTVFGSYTLCQAIRYVDIVCNQLTNSQAQKDQTSQTIARDMLCRIYVTGAGDSQSTIDPSNNAFCPPGCAPTVIYRNFTMPKQIQWIPNQNIPGFLQFQVYDDTGLLLDESVVNGTEGEAQTGYPFTDFSITMLVSEN